MAVDIDHYRWHTYCCARNKDGGCTRRCHTCKYRYDETKTDNIQIKDNVSIKHYDNNLYANLEVKDTYSSTKIGLDYSNSLELEFQDSGYKFHEFVYDIDYSKEPYFIYTLKADDYHQEASSNLLNDNNEIIVKNTANCKVTAFDFFNSFEKDCNLKYEDIDFYIEADRLKYAPNDTITISIILPFLASAIGGLFTTSSVSTWYVDLIKPSFNPPSWIFGPVWTILYLMIGIALYLVWEKKYDKKTFIIFGVQMVLNALWSILFFGMKKPLYAFIEIIFLWTAILITIIYFYKINKKSAYMLIPYLLWVSFATILNLAIVILN